MNLAEFAESRGMKVGGKFPWTRLTKRQFRGSLAVARVDYLTRTHREEGHEIAAGVVIHTSEMRADVFRWLDYALKIERIVPHLDDSPARAAYLLTRVFEPDGKDTRRAGRDKVPRRDAEPRSTFQRIL